VVAMMGKINVFEFNEMFNKSEHVFSFSSGRSFFDVRIFNNILLVYEVQCYCKDYGIRNDLSAVLDVIQRRLNKDIILLAVRKDEGMCENIYHYIFLLK
jgi:hypothetical protein